MARPSFSLRVLVGATALAVAAAVAVVIVAGPGDDHTGDEDTGDAPTSLDLTQQGEFPASVDDLVLGGLDGGEDRRLADVMDGRPVVLNFFAPWCAPCVTEMPAFEAVHQAVASEVSFVGMAVPPDLSGAGEIVERTGVTYPTYADPGGVGPSFFESVTMPTTVFLSPSGEVLEVRSRPLTEAQLRDALQRHYGVA